MIVAVPGLPVAADHVPEPEPPMVTAPPGSIAQLTFLSAPAFGLAVTTTDAVSVHPYVLVL
jgi:hypothetical protein